MTDWFPNFQNDSLILTHFFNTQNNFYIQRFAKRTTTYFVEETGRIFVPEVDAYGRVGGPVGKLPVAESAGEHAGMVSINSHFNNDSDPTYR